MANISQVSLWGGARNFCIGGPQIQGVWVFAGPRPTTLTKSLDLRDYHT